MGRAQKNLFRLRQRLGFGFFLPPLRGRSSTLIEVVRTLCVIVKYCRVGYMEIPFAGVHVPGTRACVRGGKGIQSPVTRAQISKMTSPAERPLAMIPHPWKMYSEQCDHFPVLQHCRALDDGQDAACNTAKIE